MTACVFAWEERARDSSTFMLEEMRRRTRDWKHLAARTARDRTTLDTEPSWL
jgi:myo-inositol catabolism protein IolH